MHPHAPIPAYSYIPLYNVGPADVEAFVRNMDDIARIYADFPNGLAMGPPGGYMPNPPTPSATLTTLQKLWTIEQRQANAASVQYIQRLATQTSKPIYLTSEASMSRV